MITFQGEKAAKAGNLREMQIDESFRKLNTITLLRTEIQKVPQCDNDF